MGRVLAISSLLSLFTILGSSSCQEPILWLNLRLGGLIPSLTTWLRLGRDWVVRGWNGVALSCWAFFVFCSFRFFVLSPQFCPGFLLFLCFCSVSGALCG